MSESLDETTRTELIDILSHMEDPVSLLLFVEDEPCAACLRQQEIVETVAALSEKLRVTVLKPREDRRELKRYSVDRFPATVPVGDKDYGIRFFGVTAGREFSSFLQTILMISTG